MKRYFQSPLLIFLLASITSIGQAVDARFLQKQWDAYWIAAPGVPANAYGIYFFQKQVKLDQVPDSFVVHLSADNRYKLYVNDKLVSLGPARGDLAHWNFETVNLAPALKPGINTIVAKVWNEAEWRPEAQLTLRTGFILQGATTKSAVLNTDTTWKSIRDESYSPIRINLPAYYVAGPGEAVNMNYHLVIGKLPGPASTSWKKAEIIFRGTPKGLMGPYGTPGGWMLVPSTIPPIELKEQRFQKLRKAEGTIVPGDFPAVKSPFTVSANSTLTLLLDQSELTNAYVTLAFSGGKDATILLTYAEALYSKHPEKGNRNEVEGKYIMGRRDSIVSSGATGQVFSTLYWRTFRYVQLKVVTKDQPVVIEDIYSVFTGYPFRMNAKFESGNSELDKILSIGWHTARLCAIETYMDCPYYEQLQYIGDTRIQALVTLFNSGDERLLRNAINQADESRLPEGVTLSRHPSYTPQYIPTFSLWYVGMLHDYWMYGRDSNFVKEKLSGCRQVLDYFHRYQDNDGSLKNVPHWLFTDWVNDKGWEAGRGPVGADGSSAMLDLQLLWAYQLAADMEGRIGLRSYADLYKAYARQLQSTIRKKYWHAGRGLFSDRPEQDVFSQHTNSLAILTGLAGKETAAKIGRQMLEDSAITKATIYFKYYLHQALVKAGLGDHYLDWLDIWRENIRMGMTTWAEMSDVNASRSDCHAWGASPNIEIFRTVVGIESAAPGFAKVKIEPHPGSLKALNGEIPHPMGTIAVKLSSENNRWDAVIDLPAKVTGQFIWRGKTYALKGGKNTFKLNIDNRNR